MSNKRLKIENLENLQDLNSEEFSSIQGGLTAQINLDKEVIIDDSYLSPQPEPIAFPYIDPCLPPPPPPPCEVYVFYDGEKKIEFKWCPMML